MKTETYNIRGTQINKIAFSEIESYLEEKGLNTNEAFNLLADEKEFVYVSNGFVRGLKTELNENGEWHHFFKKDEDGVFAAWKYNFN
jgi:hypothetical protein